MQDEEIVPVLSLYAVAAPARDVAVVGDSHDMAGEAVVDVPISLDGAVSFAAAAASTTAERLGETEDREAASSFSSTSSRVSVSSSVSSRRTSALKYSSVT